MFGASDSKFLMIYEKRAVWIKMDITFSLGIGFLPMTIIRNCHKILHKEEEDSKIRLCNYIGFFRDKIEAGYLFDATALIYTM